MEAQLLPLRSYTASRRLLLQLALVEPPGCPRAYVWSVNVTGYVCHGVEQLNGLNTLEFRNIPPPHLPFPEKTFWEAEMSPKNTCSHLCHGIDSVTSLSLFNSFSLF